MAVRRPEGLVVLADQREIAHSVGSVREVVARPIRSLREQGALSRLPGGRGLLIKRPEVLSGIADGIDNGSCCTSPGSRRNHKGDPARANKAPANKAPADKAPANKSHRKVSLAAWEASPLAGLPDGVRDALLDGSVVVRVPAGQPIGEAYGGPTFALVHFGHVRVQWATPEGRTATIRYAGAGQVLGLPSAVAGTTPWNGYAVTECEMTMMSGARLRHIAEKDGAVSWYLARQLVDISYDSIGVLGGNIFEPVLQRVARHLLTLAERTGGGLVVTADQDELAHSIGSVREVIARALRTLREQGVIARSAAGLMLVDPARLQEIAAGRRPDAAGESRPQRS
jgi:CRP-like cAMP-binding protein